MTLVTQIAESATELATVSRARVRRVLMERNSRRMKSELRSEMAALGHDVYRLYQAGELKIDARAVLDRTRTISLLQTRLELGDSAIEAIVNKDARAGRIRKSMANIDHNTDLRARSAQSRVDDAALAAISPTDEGGQG